MHVLKPTSTMLHVKLTIFKIVQLPLQSRPTNEYVNARCEVLSNVIEPNDVVHVIDVKFDGVC